MQNEAIIVAMVGAITLCLRLVESLIKKLLPKKRDSDLREVESALRSLDNNIDELNTKVSMILDHTKELAKLHGKSDEDGIPLWYMPRSWGSIQKDVVSIVQQIHSNQAHLIEAVGKILEK